ncbi:hypothetical protein A2125_00355 [Candidatus Woesebacteria bacterium GWB1_43_5]|uniref:Transcriptional regulator MraZ n=1 Tax=Candidatus Woesebacteria bacterium GWB1_43_5 TaxID=1802474 RepID=A0A1F7WT59_9BACT|nr:MAG: hypothetical protein A2125_00355 [Candidatus Woesebacteria bacterium GWB1_43_5]
MLIGQYETKISPKRRIAVPNKLRRNLGKKFIIARWYEGCLVLVGEDGWEKLMGRLTANMGHVTQTVRDTDRFILGSAFEVTPDPQGRVVIPEILSKYAHIKNDVIFLGLGDRAEIWDKTLWRKREEHVTANSVKLMEEMAKEDRPRG